MRKRPRQAKAAKDAAKKAPSARGSSSSTAVTTKEGGALECVLAGAAAQRESKVAGARRQDRQDRTRKA